jgi:hypothetical protein
MITKYCGRDLEIRDDGTVYYVDASKLFPTFIDVQVAIDEEDLWTYTKLKESYTRDPSLYGVVPHEMPLAEYLVELDAKIKECEESIDLARSVERFENEGR